jgi:hypothetical protein
LLAAGAYAVTGAKDIREEARLELVAPGSAAECHETARLVRPAKWLGYKERITPPASESVRA